MARKKRSSQTGRRTGKASLKSHKPTDLSPSRLKPIQATLLVTSSDDLSEALLEQGKQDKMRKAYMTALRKYKPAKSDRDRLVFIGTKGQRNPQTHGRKGYVIAVDSKGKKHPIQVNTPNPFQSRTITSVKLPYTAAAKDFDKHYLKQPKQAAPKLPANPTKAEKVRYKKAKAEYDRIQRKTHKEFSKVKIIKSEIQQLADFRASGAGRGRGKHKNSSHSPNDFTGSVVSKISRTLRKALKQHGQRNFRVRMLALLHLPDGTRKVVEAQSIINRNDADSIRKQGVDNFVNQSCYAALANALAELGLISSGSANHIRHTDIFADTDGDYIAAWEKLHDRKWKSAAMDIARIETIEYRIEQL